MQHVVVGIRNVGDNKIAQPRKIEVGPGTGDVTIITSGLNDGERVVTDWQYKLQKDSPVSITNAGPAAAPARVGSAS